MVDLFGPSQLQLIIPKTQFSQGEVIEGRVVLTLKKPTTARGLSVTLIGEKRVRSGKHSHMERLYEVSKQLDVEKEYSATRMDYEFELQVPTGLAQPKPISILGFSLGTSNPIQWRIEAKLDVPMAFDVSMQYRLTIS